MARFALICEFAGGGTLTTRHDSSFGSSESFSIQLWNRAVVQASK